MSTPVARICFVGDSLTLGVGDPEGHGWVGRVLLERRRQGIDLTGYNLGVRRNTSLDIAVRWKQEVLVRLADTHPGAIVFAFGTNDCLEENGSRRVSLSTTLAVTREILNDALRVAPVILLGPPPTAHPAENVPIAELADRLDELCSKLNVPYFHSFNALANEEIWIRELRSGDGYHPAGGGYAAVASCLLQWPAWRALTLSPSSLMRRDERHGPGPFNMAPLDRRISPSTRERQSC